MLIKSKSLLHIVAKNVIFNKFKNPKEVLDYQQTKTATYSTLSHRCIMEHDAYFQNYRKA